MFKIKMLIKPLNDINKPILVAGFIIVTLLCSLLDNNLILAGDDIGLLEHPAIWVFFLFNLAFAYFINLCVKCLKNQCAGLYDKFQANVINLIKTEKFKNLRKITCKIGFLFFVYNSFQNTLPISKLGFNFWDSIDYRYSYFITRVYKLYLFSFFYPEVIQTLLAIMIISKQMLRDNKNEYHRDQLAKLAFRSVRIFIVFSMALNLSIIHVHKKSDIVTIIITLMNMIIVIFVYLFLFINLIKERRKELTDRIKQLEKKKEKLNNKLIKQYRTSESSIKYVTLYSHYNDVIKELKSKTIHPYVNILISQLITTTIPVAVEFVIPMIKKAFLYLTSSI